MSRFIARTGRALATVALLEMLFLASPAAGQDLDEAFARDAIVVVSSAGECYHFDVWLAVTRDQQRRGLMYVRDLPPFAGMLFIYPESEQHSMWMKNTFIPLDILFIGEDGGVSSIARRTEPLSLRSIASVEPVRYVLELNAGVTETLGIDEESRILLPAELSTAL